MKKNRNEEGQKNKDLPRRKYKSKIGAATAAFTIVPRHVMANSGSTQPSDMVNVAGIGVGGQGEIDIQNLCAPDSKIVYPPRKMTGVAYTTEELAAQAAAQAARAAAQAAQPAQAGTPARAGGGGSPFEVGKTRKLANIYALCDVDPTFSGYLLKNYSKAKKYTDWRKMLEKEKSIDAVTVGTPDHNHAIIAAAFIREKKHVYVEKPLCKTVYEARVLAELAKQYDIVSQMGNQGHADEGTRQIVEWIQSGAIGNVREVHITSGSPTWLAGNLQRPAPVPVPKTIDYDIWTGPAPMKPFNPLTLHFNWRGLWANGTGELGDFGAHILDSVFWALKLDRPIRVQATSSPFNNEYYPWGEVITYEFAARGSMPPVTLTWSDGGFKTPRPIDFPQGIAMPGTLYVGDKGYLTGGRGASPAFLPANPDFKAPAPWIPRTGDIYEEWIGAIKNGTKTSNDFSFCAKIVESFLLGNVAVKMQSSNTTLEYDGANGKITNSPDANNLLHYEYRQGWTL